MTMTRNVFFFLFFAGTVTVPLTITTPEQPVYCAVMQQNPLPPPNPQQCDPNDENCVPYTPPHNKPTMACTTHNRPDGKQPCGCLKQDPDGCNKGKRVRETNVCNSWCWKDLCKCCGS